MKCWYIAFVVVAVCWFIAFVDEMLVNCICCCCWFIAFVVVVEMLVHIAFVVAVVVCWFIEICCKHLCWFIAVVVVVWWLIWYTLLLLFAGSLPLCGGMLVNIAVVVAVIVVLV